MLRSPSQGIVACATVFLMVTLIVVLVFLSAALGFWALLDHFGED